MGLKFSEHTINGEKISTTIYTLDTKKYGSSFEDIKKEIVKNNGEVEVTAHQVEIPYSEIGKYIKRFEVFTTNEFSKNIRKLIIEE
ncbi:hypothetical protein AAG747_22810 [Rapidithrix thailandica]|uniref:Uncharacterized protein n=1 Tax=Rapidithrix thailandica TaxID=413964 RepID=A0AAW9SDZ7_9BACT